MTVKKLGVSAGLSATLEAKPVAKKTSLPAVKKRATAGFSKSLFVGASAGGAVGRLGAVGQGAITRLESASRSFKSAATEFKGLPSLAQSAQKLASATAGVASNPPSYTGPLMADVNALRERATSLFDTAKKTIAGAAEEIQKQGQRGLELLKTGAQKLTELGRDLTTATNEAKKELEKKHIEDPIDAMKPGGEVSIVSGVDGSVAIPGLNAGEVGISVAGKGEHSVKVKMNDDGSITIKQETGGAGGLKGGADLKNEANASGDVNVGGSVANEYKVEVKRPDGTIDIEATKEKAKQLTKLLAEPPRVDPASVMTVVSANNPKLKTREELYTPDEWKLMNDCHVATEFKGTAAQNIAISIGLPNVGNANAGTKTQADFTIRIEKVKDMPVRDANGKPELLPDGTPMTQEGMRVTTSVSSSSEGQIDGTGHTGTLKRSVNPDPLNPMKAEDLETVHADVKASNKVTLTTTFDYPGEKEISVADVAELRNQTPHVSAELTHEAELQGGGGTGQNLDVVVAKGGNKDVTRIGATTKTTIKIDNPLQAAQEVFDAARANEIEKAARAAGKNVKIEVETTVYQERSRTAGGGFKVGELGEYNVKLESTERVVLRKSKVESTSVESMADAAAAQYKKLQAGLNEKPNRPFVMRA
jgi:hypothetical protein